MKIIGVTGGVGSGKSEVVNFIARRFDATVVQADAVGYLLMKPGNACFEPIVALFGPEILREDGKLDREKIASIVFNNKEMIEKLNAIVHPAVKKYINKAIEREKKYETQFFVIEAALLIEANCDEICDELWYVYADEQTRIERLKLNRGYSDEKIREIVQNQLSEEEFSRYCHFEVDNSGDFEDTKAQIEQRMRKYEVM